MPFYLIIDLVHKFLEEPKISLILRTEQGFGAMTARDNSIEYRPEIDGLRALAVIPVLLYHAQLGASGGFVGVDVFFVISGFLITSLLLKRMEAGSLNLLEFWERRIRRLFPALAVMTLVFLLHAIGSFVEVRGDSVPKARISPQQVRSIPLSVSDRINLACARHWHKQIRRYGVPVA